METTRLENLAKRLTELNKLHTEYKQEIRKLVNEKNNTLTQIMDYYKNVSTDPTIPTDFEQPHIEPVKEKRKRRIKKN